MCRAEYAADTAPSVFHPTMTPACSSQWTLAENAVSLTVLAAVLGGMLMALSPSVPELPRHIPAIESIACLNCGGLPPGRPCRTQVDRRPSETPALTLPAQCRRT